MRHIFQHNRNLTDLMVEFFHYKHIKCMNFSIIIYKTPPFCYLYLVLSREYPYFSPQF